MLQQTPLHSLHQRLGAKLVPFAGWEMPLQYEGVIAEHLWCRNHTALFDVSHMAVVDLTADSIETVAQAVEAVTPAGITTLGVGRQRYGLLMNDDGGVVDDFMITNRGTHMTMVVNASRRDVDLPYLKEHLSQITVTERLDVALVAIQGPTAAQVLGRLADQPSSLGSMVFLDNQDLVLNIGSGPVTVNVSRSGYTGEDGFELAIPADSAETVAQALLVDDEVKPAGLGARDTLRLEAGLCLYGNDLDETTSPVEANLVWSMPKRRREAGDYVGAKRVSAELADGPTRIRVGLKPEGKRPVRDGSALSVGEKPVGVVSSGGFGPSVDGPVAMGYVSPENSSVGTPLVADVRGREVNCAVADLPFSPHRYVRSAQ